MGSGVWPNTRELSNEMLLDVGIVLKAYSSVLSDLAYVSMPITSGRILYDIFEEYGVSSLQELNEKDTEVLVKKVIVPNLEMGKKFAHDVETRTDLPVVAPCEFEAKKKRWAQDEYMYMWLQFIENKVVEIHMIEGWQYTNGGAEEFTRGIEMQFNFCDRRDVTIFDHNGNEIQITEGVKLISEAIHNINYRGFSPGELPKMVHKLTSVAGYFNDSLTTASEWHAGMAYDLDWGAIKEVFNSLPVTS